MKITVNGTAQDVQASTLAALLAELGYGDAKVATALNEGFIPTGARASTPITDGDRIEIDIPNRTINLAVDDATLAARREAKGPLPWGPAEKRPRAVSTALKAYALLASSADKGGVRILPE